MTHVGQNMLL